MAYVILLNQKIASHEIFPSMEEAVYAAKRIFFFLNCLEKQWLDVPTESAVKNGCFCCGTSTSNTILAICDDEKLSIQQMFHVTPRMLSTIFPSSSCKESKCTSVSPKKKIQIFIKQATTRLITIEIATSDTFNDFLQLIKEQGISGVSLLTYAYNGKRLHELSSSLYDYIPENCVVTGNIQTLPPAYYDPRM